MSTLKSKTGTSVLELTYHGSKAYEWKFRVPPRSQIVKHFSAVKMIPGIREYGFNDLQFTEGPLANIKHSWCFKIIGCTETIEVELWIRNIKNYGISVHPSKLQTFTGQQLKNQVPFTLDAVTDPEPSSRKWKVSMQVPENVWDDSVDTLKVTLNIQCEQLATCSNIFPGQTGSDLPKKLFLEEYLMSDFLSDVTLVVQGEEIPAHRVILSSRSPVFKCMFQHDMKENSEGRVVIDDIEPEVVKEMLQFVYTGVFSVNVDSSNSGQMIVEVFKAADKYGFETLKSRCANQITKTITLGNALEMYILGETHNDKALKSKALALMKSDKAKCIQDPETLREFTLSHPLLAFELFTI